MPDGDILRLGILRSFAQAYKQICEASGSSDDWAREAARGVRVSIKHYGPAPMGILRSMAGHFTSALNSNGQSSHIWIDLDQQIDRVKQRVRGSRQGIHLATEACHELLNKMEQGHRPNDLLQELIQSFVEQVYATRFLASVASVPKHWNNVDSATVDERLLAMEPEIKRQLNGFADQLLVTRQRLRLRRRRGPKPMVNADTDLL